MNVIFEMPFKAPHVSFNNFNNKINITGKRKERVSAGLSVDDQGRIYLVVTTRPKSELEKKTFYVYEGSSLKTILPKNFNEESTDRFCLLIFNKSGKIIAFKKLSVFCDNIYVNNNHLFIIDSYIDMKIYEYRISFDL